MELKQSRTFQNLVNSFAGECQAHARYEFLVWEAKKMQLYEIGCALEEIAKNELQHAKRFYEEIRGADPSHPEDLKVDAGYPFKETNGLEAALCAAADNEYNESVKIYAQYAKQAHDEGFDPQAALFELIASVEHCHMMQLNNIREQLRNGTLYRRGESVKWKCSQCGHEQTTDEAPQKCPLCGNVIGYVKLILPDN